MTPRVRVALVLPSSMVLRNTLETPVLSHLAAQEAMEVCLLTPPGAAKDLIAHQKAPHLTWADLGRPAQDAGFTQGGAVATVARVAQRLSARLARPWVGFGQLVYRFNHIQGFAGHRHKVNLPPEARAREAQAGNFVEPDLGRPLPGSRLALALVYGLYHATWYSEPAVEAFFDDFRPRLLVIHHVQLEAIRPYACAARRRGIPILGIVASWDQPTTKGPLPPGINRFLVQSQRMAEELTRFHGVHPDLIQVTGWPQMDVYRQPGFMMTRTQLMDELGLERDRRFILLGANTARLGAHEPSIAAHLARGVQEGRLGENVTLLVRPHPKDRAWQERLGHLHAPPQALVLPAEMGRLNFLASLLQHAGALVCSSGSIALDAAALDTPVVNLAFDGDLNVPPERSVKRWLELDHYRPVVESGGVRLAASFTELDQAVGGYLQDPALDAAGRARLRAEQLEPLDGKASERVVAEIIKVAGG